MRAPFEPRDKESCWRPSLAFARSRTRTIRLLIDLMIQAASHPSPWVRSWGVMALGGVHSERACRR